MKAFETAKQLEEAINGYYQECAENVIIKRVGGAEFEVAEPLTMSGLADSLGVCRDTLSVYAKGEYDTKAHCFSDLIRKAKTKIERDKVARATLGLYDRTISIFDLKNNHGWVDKREFEGTMNDNRKPREMTRAEIEAELAAELKGKKAANG